MAPVRAFHVIEIWTISDGGMPNAIGIVPELYKSRDEAAIAFKKHWPFESKDLTSENCWVSDITPSGSCFCVITTLTASTPSTRISYADLKSRYLE